MRWILIEEWLAGRMTSDELEAWLYLEFTERGKEKQK